MSTDAQPILERAVEMIDALGRLVDDANRDHALGQYGLIGDGRVRALRDEAAEAEDLAGRLRELQSRQSAPQTVRDRAFLALAELGALATRARREADRRPLTDYGLAERLEHAHHRDLMHVPGIGWHAWTGTHWSRDGADSRVTELLLEVARTVHDEARSIAPTIADRQRADDADGDLADRLEKETKNRAKVANAIHQYAVKSEAEPRLRAAANLAAGLPGLRRNAHDLDTNPWLLACPNGTVDLRTAELRAADPADLITKVAGAPYDPDATDPLWDRFLDDATGGNTELRDYLQRVVGYTLTGSTDEEAFFLFHGPAASGKTTFAQTIRAAIGDHAVTADFETFLAKKTGGGGPRNGIAQLAGARMALASEVDDGRRLAAGVIKQLTGGDTVVGSFLYRDAFEFTPRFKLWLLANHAPAIDRDDSAMWRRVHLIPLDHTVPARRRDPGLKRHLTRPNPRVLAWAIQGAEQWHQHGLQPPDAVLAATRDYRDDQGPDPLRAFLDEHTTQDADAWTATADLTAAYTAVHGEEPYPKALGSALRDRGCRSCRSTIDGRKLHGWRGISLLTDRQDHHGPAESETSENEKQPFSQGDFPELPVPAGPAGPGDPT